mmetsp:Transcript_4503/g.6625  ORF Transcript_4503/g.6625 Transcript_4503/m.6625 type:complete len:186 (+) Transcript_4503:111-668(+)
MIRNATKNVIKKSRGVPLSQIVSELNTTRKFSTTQQTKGGATDPNKKPHWFWGWFMADVHEPVVVDENDKKYGIVVPKEMAKERFFAKLCGAFAAFWTFYMFREKGLELLGFEHGEWDHPFSDTESDEQDEIFLHTAETDKEIEAKIELLRASGWKPWTNDRRLAFRYMNIGKEVDNIKSKFTSE